MGNSAHDVHAVSTPAGTTSNLRWNDLRIFMLTARHSSLRSAADAQRLHIHTVRTALNRLEEEYGATLVRRSRAGIQLTETGRRLLEEIRDFQPTPVGGTDQDVLIQPGEIRISSSDALGLFWLTSRLGDLSSRLPETRVNLQLSYDLAKDLSAGHDVGLTYHLPDDPDLIVARLATIHIMLFASRGYLAAHGNPTTFDEMRNHKYVEHVSNGVNSGIVDNIFGQHRPAGFVPICSNSAGAQFWAVERGVGIGAFPTYVAGLTDRVVPVAMPFQLRFELYYYFHAHAKRSPTVQTTIAWLKECFDPGRHPCFGERFVHPRDFLGRPEEPHFGDTFMATMEAGARL